MKNLSGTYSGILKSNYSKVRNDEICAKIIINHKLNDMTIELLTEKSRSKASSIHIDNTNHSFEITYTYSNIGEGDNKTNKSHIGTAIVIIDKNTLTGDYYNNGRDRNTYGKIEMEKNNES